MGYSDAFRPFDTSKRTIRPDIFRVFSGFVVTFAHRSTSAIVDIIYRMDYTSVFC